MFRCPICVQRGDCNQGSFDIDVNLWATSYLRDRLLGCSDCPTCPGHDHSTPPWGEICMTVQTGGFILFSQSFGGRLSFMLWRTLEDPQLHLEKYATSIQSALLERQHTASVRLATCHEVPGRSETGGVNGWIGGSYKDSGEFEDASILKIAI
jgi:hypothetical protein